MLPALLFALLSLPKPSEAHASSEDLSSFFSTAAPYTPGQRLPAPVPTGYVVAGLSSVARHGSRYPTAGKIRGCQQLESMLVERGDVLALPWMREWRCRWDPLLEGVLWPRGTRELRGIGSRVAELYPDALLPYNPNTVVSTSTSVRTPIASAVVHLFLYSPPPPKQTSEFESLR
eukprot:m51a1_g12722 hypothetical protein (175) ;mRNA; f:2681-3205